MSLPDFDLRIRMAAFDWLAGQVEIHGDVLPRRPMLEGGFPFENDSIPLVSPQGIYKPGRMALPLSITTTTGGPYDDHFGRDGFLRYSYRGTNPNHPDNAGLRRVMELKKPLIYFHAIVPNQYLAVWPVFLVGDNPVGLSFTVAMDDMDSVRRLAGELPVVAEDPLGKRQYITAVVRRRLHQRSFRERVLAAYRSQCAFCRLRHRELLDAAHIWPDNNPEGEPTVDNGLSLCKLHHAAFDSFILGVTPEFVIHVREDVLQEEDGPLLRVGLQQLHGSRLVLPSSMGNWPSREALAWRYEQFGAR